MTGVIDMANVIPFTSLAALKEAHSELLQRRRAEGESPALLDAASAFVARAQATGALLDEDGARDTAQSLLTYWDNLLYRAGRIPPESTLAEFDPLLAPELPDTLCPYLGLEAFRENDGDKFYGRRELIARLVERLNERRLIAVVGPSGSGKSSVVRAGLIPALHNGSLPGSEEWVYWPPIVPGSDPLGSLDHVLRTENGHSQGQPRTEEDPLVLGSPVLGSPVVLVVDQFEELFTLCDDEGIRTTFVDRLLALAEAPGLHHRVILTMRSDFETFIARLPRLQPLFEVGRVQATPLSAAELREAIEQPAAAVGLKFEAGLVEALLQEILGEPAALPLLQFTLLKLWENRERNRVTWAAYRKVGGGRLALARSADAFYAALIPEEQTTARRILLRMVRPGEGLEITSSRIRRTDLYRGGEDPGRVERVLARLVAARLVRLTAGDLPGDTQIEVAHEALVRNWPTLVDWLQEEKVALAIRRRFEGRAVEWERLGRGTGGLLDEVELREAERWLTSSEADYLGYDPTLPDLVAASKRAIERRKQRLTRLRIGLVLVSLTAAVLGIGLALYAFRQRQDAIDSANLAAIAQAQAQQDARNARTAEAQAQQQRNLAQAAQAESQSLAHAGEVFFELDHRSERALLLALASTPTDTIHYQPVVSRAFYRAFESALIRRSLQGHTSIVRAVKWSPDGHLLLTGGDDGTVRLWDAASGATKYIFEGHSGPIRTVSWSPDGRYVLTGSIDTTARIWNVATGTVVQTLRGHTGTVSAAVWSPDGKEILTGSYDASARIWDATTGTQIRELRGHLNAIRAVAWSPDGQRILTGSDDQTARVWDAAAGAEMLVLRGHTLVVSSVAWSPDGRQALTGSGDATARVWDASTGSLSQTLLGHLDWVWSVAWSPDGKKAITGSFDGTARIWDITTGKAIQILRGHTAQIWSVDWSPDSRHLATGSEDTTARIWDATTGVSMHSPQEAGTKQSTASWSKDFRYVATGAEDGSAHIWTLDTGKEIFFLRGHQVKVSAVAWSDDSRRLATGDEQGTVCIWDATTGKQVALIPGSVKVSKLEWGPDGDHIAIISETDGITHVWNITTAQEQHVLSRPGTTARSIVWSRDGRFLLTGYQDGTADVWNTLAGKQEYTITGHTGPIWAAQWSPDGRYIITGSGDRTARIWNVISRKEERKFEAHTGNVVSVVWSPDGSNVLTASSDGTVKIWDVNTGTELRTLQADTLAGRIALWSADGRYILKGGSDGKSIVWLVSSDVIRADVIRRVCNLFTDDLIRAEIPSWHGCAAEQSAVASALAIYDKVYGSN